MLWRPTERRLAVILEDHVIAERKHGGVCAGVDEHRCCRVRRSASKSWALAER
jgi:hypothetical protein